MTGPSPRRTDDRQPPWPAEVAPMTERDIFLAVIDLPDQASRSAYLDMVCGEDLALRKKVEGLLRSHESAGSFLAAPAVAPADPDHAGTRAFAPTPDPDAESTGVSNSRPAAGDND